MQNTFEITTTDGTIVQETEVDSDNLPTHTARYLKVLNKHFGNNPSINFDSFLYDLYKEELACGSALINSLLSANSQFDENTTLLQKILTYVGSLRFTNIQQIEITNKTASETKTLAIIFADCTCDECKKENKENCPENC
jgi:hypothetical protein